MQLQNGAPEITKNSFRIGLGYKGLIRAHDNELFRSPYFEL